MLTQARLKELFHYDPETGVFTHRARPDNPQHTGKFAGKVAGARHAQGYVSISVDNKRYLAHRLAWLYVYGEWPERDVDHKDTNKQNNRIDNLRLATMQENQFNRKLSKNNTSGIKGVTWDRHRNKWVAQVMHNRKHIGIGRFDTIEQAAAAVRQKRRELQGDFARDG